MDRELRILILEDDSTDAELVQRELRKAGIVFSPLLVDSRKEFIKGLEEFSPDLILADYKLPSFDGISALDISQEKCPDIPFIFVTGVMGEEWAVDTLKRGAWDYVIKDRIYRLASVVQRALQDAKERTERKRAEEALRQAEEKYRGIFENALDGIFQATPDGRYIIVNSAFVNMLGYKSPSEFIATVTDIGHQLYVQPERYNKLKQLLDEHSVVQEFEIQMYRKNGSIIWISLNARTIRDDHGVMLYYEGTAQDITEQKKIRDVVKPSTLLLRLLCIFGVVEVLIMFVFSLIDIPHGIWEDLADGALLTIFCTPFVYWWVVRGLTRHLVREVTVAQTKAQTNEYQYHTLIDIAPDIVYTLASGDGIITLLNSAFETVTGWSHDEWIGKTFAALVHPDDLKLAAETFQKILKGENTPPFELRILTKSGTYLVGEFTSVPQFELGKIVGVLGIARDITERKRAEEALHKSEAELKEAQRVGQLGSWDWDTTIDTITWSEEYYRIYGLDSTQRPPGYEEHLKLYTPESAARLDAAVKRNMQTGERYQLDLELARMEGSPRWVKVRSETKRDDKGQIVGLRGTAQDITARKRTEEELKKRSAFIQTVLDNLPIGIALNEIDKGNTIYTNKKFEEIYGWSKDEIKDVTDFFEKVYPDKKYREELMTKVIADIQSGDPSRMHWEGSTVTHKDGSKHIINAVNIPLFEQNTMVSTAIDITEQQLAEEELLKLSRAVEQSPASIIITDTNGNIEYVNPKVTEITGYQLAEIIGQNPRIFSSREKSKSNYKVLWDTIISGKEWRGELHNKKKNGELFWESVAISPIINEKGETMHYLAVKEDITERKMAEQRLIIANKELVFQNEEKEKRAVELIAAKEKAEEMSRLKSNFLANMSHELRTPLIGISGFSDILRQDLENPELKEMAETIFNSGTRLSETLNLILDLSKLESEKMDFAYQQIDLVTETEVIINLFKQAARKKGLYLKSSFNQPSIFINTDERAYRSILNNLINNAIKFTNEGGIAADISLKDNFVEIKVSDSGIGIAKEYHDIIFEEFRQVSEGFSRNFEGTGLGLNITKKLVEKFGGKISVESEPGKGSTFIVKLPVTSAVKKIKEEPVIGKVPLKVLTEQKSVKPLALLVDDDPLVYPILKRYTGGRVDLESTPDGGFAVKLCGQKQYDYIFMDINLRRGMDGVQATQAIRKIKGYESIPIIATTAYAMVGDKEEFLAAGCSHYLSKPFNQQEISNLLEEILSGR